MQFQRTLSSAVKSIQSGLASITPSNSTVTVTIAAVNTGKSFVVGNSRPVNSGAGVVNDFCFASAKLISPTQVQVSRVAGVTGYNTAFEFQVIEYV